MREQSGSGTCRISLDVFPFSRLREKVPEADEGRSCDGVRTLALTLTLSRERERTTGRQVSGIAVSRRPHRAPARQHAPQHGVAIVEMMDQRNRRMARGNCRERPEQPEMRSLGDVPSDRLVGVRRSGSAPGTGRTSTAAAAQSPNRTASPRAAPRRSACRAARGRCARR